MKKIVSLLLTLAMLLTFLTVPAYATTYGIGVTADKTSVKQGNQVTFTVAIDKVDVAVTGLQLKLNYDKAKLEYVSSTNMNAFPASDTELSKQEMSGAEYVYYAYANNGEGYTVDARKTLFTATFKVIASAPGSVAPILECVASSDADLNDLPLSLTQATVSIPKPAITSVDVNVNAPSKGVAFATTATVPAGAEYSVTSVKWFKSNGNEVSGDAAPSTVYTVKVVVTAASGSTFAKNVTAANGFTVKRDSDAQLTLTKTFPATAAHDCVWATEWSHDANSHWHACTVSGCNLRKAEAEHSGGTATCTDKAVCEICHVEYGNPLGHNLKKVAGTPATCTTPGTKEYWECQRENCHEKFLDSKGQTLATAENTKIPALGHKMVKTEAKAATCTATGNIEYYTCSVCKKLFTNEAGTTETTLEAVTIPMVAHTASNKYVAGATQHWTFCTVCGEVLTKVDHTYVNGKCECGATNKDAAVDANHKDHKAGGNNYFNETKHWADCGAPNCAGHVGEANHSLTTKRTIVVNGKTYEVKECVCGYVTRVEVKNNTTGTTTGTNPNAKNPYEKNDTTKKDNGKTVKSGKTFDAGIALYVGLSVLSVTGGALVIGKKKEF